MARPPALPQRTAAVAAALAALGAWSLAEPHLPVLRHVDVPVLPPGTAPLTVLHLSDLHLLPRQHGKLRFLRGLRRLAPDLVVSTGDHLSSASAMPQLVEALGSFDAPGVFVPGNNDYYTPTPPDPLRYLFPGGPLRRTPDLDWPSAAAALVAAGWTDLTHRRVQVGRLLLTGTDDAHLRRDRYAKVAGPVDPPSDGVAVGVTHTPARRVLDPMAADGHRLLLAGHTHGGQLRLPGVGALVTNCDLDRARARGLSRYGPAWLHVSAGLGGSPWVPVRLLCRPEATLLRLVPVR
jgi:uncharacterized protein